MGKPNFNRQTNRDIGKMYQEINRDEKKNSHRRLKVRAMCTHTKGPMQPYLTYETRQSDGVPIFICKNCQEKIDLRVIPDDELKKAIDTVVRACNFIKIMSTGSEKDVKLIETAISPIQMYCSAFLYDAYKAANKNKNRKMQHGSGQRGGGNVFLSNG